MNFVVLLSLLLSLVAVHAYPSRTLHIQRAQQTECLYGPVKRCVHSFSFGKRVRQESVVKRDEQVTDFVETLLLLKQKHQAALYELFRQNGLYAHSASLQYPAEDPDFPAA